MSKIIIAADYGYGADLACIVILNVIAPGECNVLETYMGHGAMTEQHKGMFEKEIEKIKERFPDAKVLREDNPKPCMNINTVIDKEFFRRNQLKPSDFIDAFHDKVKKDR